MKPDTKVSEIADSSSSEAAKSARPVVTPEKLISALQGRLQEEAEKAVRAAAAKQVSEVQGLLSKQLEAMKLSLKTESSKELATLWSADLQKYRSRAEETGQRLEKQSDELQRELANAQQYVDKLMQEVGPSIPSKVKETIARATSEFESAAAEVSELRFERLLENLQGATEEALSRLNAHSAEVQTSVQNALNSRLEEFRRDTELHVSKALMETKERVDSALSSLEEETQSTCEARRQALEAEIARSAEHAAEQFHKRITTFLHTCLEATDGVVGDHSKSPSGKRTKDKE